MPTGGPPNPYYIEEEVRLSPTPHHGLFLDQAVANLQAFYQLRGQSLVYTREAVIRDLPPAPNLPTLAHARHRIEPDLALWSPETRIQARQRYMSWPQDGPPRLVLECLVDTTVIKDTQDNPAIYDHMGVTEYWICDALATTLTGYQRAATGAWVAVTPPDNTTWSAVLQTFLRIHPDHKFQCWHAATERWITAGDDRQEGFQEGLETGHQEGLQEGLETGRQEGLEGLIRVFTDMAHGLWSRDYEVALRQWQAADNPEYPLSAQALFELHDQGLTPEDVVNCNFAWPSLPDKRATNA